MCLSTCMQGGVGRAAGGPSIVVQGRRPLSPTYLLASLTPGSAHCTGKPRGSGWDSGRTKLPNPRAPPMPSDAD